MGLCSWICCYCIIGEFNSIAIRKKITSSLQSTKPPLHKGRLCLYDRELRKIRCHFFSAISMVVVGKAKSHPSLCTASIICRFSRFLACKKSARRVVVTYIRQRKSML